MPAADEMGLTPEAANAYEAFFVPAVFSQWPGVMIASAEIGEGEDVLDVGCGTGVLTRELTRHVRDTGSTIGFDLSESMLGVARKLCPDATFKQGNVTELPFDDKSFDAVISSFMLMFVPDPVASIREMRRVLRPGGRLVASVWQGLDGNIVYKALVEATGEVAGDSSAESMAWPFSMGQSGRLAGIFEAAGIGNATITGHDGKAEFPSVEDFVATEVQAWLLADSVDEGQIGAMVKLLRTKYPAFAGSSGAITFPLNALIGKAIVS